MTLEIDEETWRPLPVDMAYDVSDRGRVRHTETGRICKLRLDRLGYARTKIKGRDFLASRLVLMAFVGLPPTRKHEAAHNDGNPRNNHVSNLRWATHKENAADMAIHGTLALGEKHGRCRISDEKVAQLRADRATQKITQADLAVRYGISRAQVQNILHGRDRIRGTNR